MIEFENVEIDHCLDCGGVWLDAGELGMILHGRPDADDDEWFRGDRPDGRRCPMCRAKMTLATLPGPDVEIDVCGRRHGVWLDKGELQRIIGAEAGDGRAGKLRDACAKIFGAEKT